MSPSAINLPVVGPSLETARLRLVQWRPDHLDALAEIFADADNMRYIGGPQTRSQVANILLLRAGHWAIKGFGWFALEERPSARLAGWCGLRHLTETPEMEMLFAVARPDQGKGYVTEAAKAVLAWAAAKGLPRPVLYINPANAASIRVAERLGAAFSETIELNGFKTSVYRFSTSTGAAD